MGLIDKITLRAIVAIASVFSLIGIVIYLIIRSSPSISITGSIDVSQIMTAFLTLVGVVLGWLFGREQRA